MIYRNGNRFLVIALLAVAATTNAFVSPSHSSLTKIAPKITSLSAFPDLQGAAQQTTQAAQTVATDTQTATSRMTYGRFLEYLDNGWVKQVDLYDNSRTAVVVASSPELGNRPQSLRVDIPVGASQLINKLKESKVDFDAHTAAKTSALVSTISNLIFPLLFIGGLYFLFGRSSEGSEGGGGFGMGGGNPMDPMGIGKSPAKERKAGETDTGVTFNDIAGIDEARGEFEEIVSFLKEPDRYTVVGAKIPKGVLLVGPPGTGKTLLAKAIATEAEVPFYSASGSEFVEMFVGIGAARIRDLFKKASENTPCIVFIDEIDAVGRERGSGIGGGNDEREQTLNQLLTEMDGFRGNSGVIVVGATNRADILDNALLRPGRFDRQVQVGLPDREGRIKILKVHARNKPLEDDVSLKAIANRTPGFAGADLANLLNEAAILATRYKKKSISKNEINEAVDRIVGGIAGTVMEDTKNKRLIAYHEVGHAIVGSVLTDHDPVEKVTLVPRGNAKGLTWFTPEEDQGLVSYNQLLSRIISTIAGRVTEQTVFGDAEVTTGASNDIQQLTNVARQMVTRYGMSSIGPIALEDENGVMQPSVVNRIDEEVTKIISSAEKTCKKIISDNRVVIDLLVEELMEKETIDGEEFEEILATYTKKAPVPV